MYVPAGVAGARRIARCLPAPKGPPAAVGMRGRPLPIFHCGGIHFRINSRDLLKELTAWITQQREGSVCTDLESCVPQ